MTHAFLRLHLRLAARELDSATVLPWHNEQLIAEAIGLLDLARCACSHVEWVEEARAAGAPGLPSRSSFSHVLARAVLDTGRARLLIHQAEKQPE